MYTTDTNKTARVLPGKKLLNFQNYITRTAGNFGLTVLSAVIPKQINPVNVDALYAEAKRLVAARKLRHIHGLATKFVNIANKVGVALNTEFVYAGPLNVLVDANVISWDAFEGVPAPVTYNVQVLDEDGIVIYNLTGLTVTETDELGDLEAATDYVAKVRAVWNGGKNYSGWTIENFTTD